MPVMELLGAALGPHYTVERELTGGGMSRVVVAYDRHLGRRVVVKLLPPDLAATVSLERFRREILVVAGLQHPNIVPVLAAGEAQGLPYLVMPFVEGESLRLRVARGPLRVVETVGILRDVARALAYAHERGIVHRDVKPDNVLLSSGAAVVADFGVAKAIAAAAGGDRAELAERAEGGERASARNLHGTITAAGTTLGTPDYMAPEQIAADPAADHRVDLYALGAMGYEMLAGVPPFHDRSPQALLAAHLTEVPRPLAEHRADLPEALCRLVMRCLEKEPARRPPSAGAVIEALEDPSVVSGAFATPLSLPTGTMPAATPSRRRRVLVAAAGGLALLAAGVLGARQLATSDDARPAAVATAPAAPATPSLAVLPLTYVGADSSFAYVAQGMTSELTSAAGRVRGLRVLSQGAAEQLRARLVRGDSARGTVAMFLEGVVQREGDQLRVDARIVSTSDGFMLWANSYEGTVAERFQLQRALGEAVAAALAEHLAPGDSTR